MLRSLSLLLMLSFAAPALAQNIKETATVPPAMVPNSFADLAASVQDAVVNVSTTQKIPQALQNNGRSLTPGAPSVVPLPDMQQFPQFPPGSPFQDFFEDFFNQQMNPNGQGGGQGGPGGQMLSMPPAQSLGSGFIIDAAKGLVVTNNHVIADADEIKVILHNDTQLEATVLGRDLETDLAVLKIANPKADKLTQVSWGDSDALRVGDWILAVGNPFGLGGTVTSGIVSARQRNINAGRYDDFIQTDASINRGNSGGPMFSMNGAVIGINTAIFSPSGGSVGIGFAIPSNLAKPVIDQIVQFGSTKRGWIGVKIQEVTPEIADSLGLKSASGALVAGVTPDGPAVKAGLKSGDVIVKFNKHDITSMRRLPRIVADTPIGQSVPVTIVRAGKEMTLQLTPGQLETARDKGLLDEQAANEPHNEKQMNDTEVAALQLHVAPLDDLLRQQYNLGTDVSGVVVTQVERASDAAQKGIIPGDVLLEVNQHGVKSASDVSTAVKDARGSGRNSVLLLVNSQNNLRFVAVKLSDNKKAAEKKPADKKESDKTKSAE